MDLTQALSLDTEEIIAQLDEHGVTCVPSEIVPGSYVCTMRDGAYESLVDSLELSILLTGIVWGKKRAALV